MGIKSATLYELFQGEPQPTAAVVDAKSADGPPPVNERNQRPLPSAATTFFAASEGCSISAGTWRRLIITDSLDLMKAVWPT